MTVRMFGAETEYAFAAMGRDRAVNQADFVQRLMQTARRRLKHLPDSGMSGGMFLENGSRFYVDCGLHPELCTPECTDPWELARYLKANERTLEALVEQVQEQAGPNIEVICSRCNVDYSGTYNTWGSHESYLHRVSPAALPGHLIPHLVSRVVYTGAGGFSPFEAWPRFCIAPRLLHIRNVVSSDSTSNRGIFHTKNETLSSEENSRLHIICGESLCSETALVLKLGATALVVAMAEAGLEPARAVRLAAPLEALHQVARDPACREKLDLERGVKATAIEIQHHLLAAAENSLDQLPPWAARLCALWRSVLDRLEGAPDSVADLLDWAIKHRLFRDHAARGGIEWGEFDFLAGQADQLRRHFAAAGVDQKARIEAVLAQSEALAGQAKPIAARLAARGHGWSTLEHFARLRDDLYQIDTRFGQLGPRGIFATLDERGVLAHRAEGVEPVEPAMHLPPAQGRAKLRGEAVSKLAGQPHSVCGWMGVTSGNHHLDLRDPFVEEQAWSVIPPSPAAEPVRPPSDWLIEMLVEENTGGSPPETSRLRELLTSVRRRNVRVRTGAQNAPAPPESPGR